MCALSKLMGKISQSAAVMTYEKFIRDVDLRTFVKLFRDTGCQHLGDPLIFIPEEKRISAFISNQNGYECLQGFLLNHQFNHFLSRFEHIYICSNINCKAIAETIAGLQNRIILFGYFNESRMLIRYHDGNAYNGAFIIKTDLSNQDKALLKTIWIEELLNPIRINAGISEYKRIFNDFEKYIQTSKSSLVFNDNKICAFVNTMEHYNEWMGATYRNIGAIWIDQMGVTKNVKYQLVKILLGCINKEPAPYSAYVYSFNKKSQSFFEKNEFQANFVKLSRRND